MEILEFKDESNMRKRRDIGEYDITKTSSKEVRKLYKELERAQKQLLYQLEINREIKEGLMISED